MLEVFSKTTRIAYCAFLLLLSAQEGEAAFVTLVNLVPNSQSSEQNHDSEVSLTVNPSNPLQMAASAFTPDPSGGSYAPIYVSSNGGNSWVLNSIVPGNDPVSGTKDITLRFGSSSNVLYAAALVDYFQLNILRTSNFVGSVPMVPIVDRIGVDQPYIYALSAMTSGGVSTDRVYVGDNNCGESCTDCPSLEALARTASTDHSVDAAGGAPPSGFDVAALEPRPTDCLDLPSVRPAVHSNGTVYVAYIGPRSRTGVTVKADIVVARDDNWGTATPRFSALMDPGDGLAGVRVVTGTTIPAVGTLLGKQRVGSSLAIAVDPATSDRVYVAWADGSNAASYAIHIRASTDGGKTWTSDIRSISSATNPSLAIDELGRLGFLYQQLTRSGTDQIWETHFEITSDDFVSNTTSLLLHRAPDDLVAGLGAGPLGDYTTLSAVGRIFFGSFSGKNTPDAANFPLGIQYQRNADFATKTLLGTNGTTPIGTSIDPFFFKVGDLATISICKRVPEVCKVPPKLRPDFIELTCRVRPCVILDPIPKNCTVKFKCPGCRQGEGCPPFYRIYLDDIPEGAWMVDLLDKDGRSVPHAQFRTGSGLVISFRPSKDAFVEGAIGDYALAFHLGPAGKVETTYVIPTRLEVAEQQIAVARKRALYAR